LRLWLDDRRPAPPGWTQVTKAEDIINFLSIFGDKITHISLDHDLGYYRTGYDVVCWIEEMVIESGFIPPEIYVHSNNPVGRARMEAGIQSIKRKLQCIE